MTEDSVSIVIHRGLLIGLLIVSGVSAVGVPGAGLALARGTCILHAGSVVAVRGGSKGPMANGRLPLWVFWLEISAICTAGKRPGRGLRQEPL